MTRFAVTLQVRGNKPCSLQPITRHSGVIIHSGFLQFLLALLLLVGALPFSALQAASIDLPPASDLRVIVDISGSMKKNDPQNLRRPAVNLITRLVPDGAEAGVWTFGQYVNELIKHGPVDQAWRENARRQAEKINSVALYTNIGTALEKASADLKPDGSAENTHFILLTDGVVDISRESAVNVKERERVVGEVLDKIRRSGAHIHTVALSRNADLTLMERIAGETDGISALAETSDDLTRVFLQAFQQVSPAEEIPLDDDGFEIDSNVEEFTALLFRNADSPAVELTDPSGQVLTQAKADENVSWYQQPGYDLITVRQPNEGSWKLKATLEPGSRVTVVSNLRMITEALPANFFAGDVLNLETGFFEDGKLVTRPEFLRLLDVDVTIQQQGGKAGTKRISDHGKTPADGLFRETIGKLKEVGVYHVTVQADGKTFKRQTRQRIELNPPFSVELEATGTGAETAYKIIARILNPNIDTARSALVVRIGAPDGGTIIKSLEYNEQRRQWELPIEPVRGEGIYKVSLRVDGVTRQGPEFRFEPKEVLAEFPRQEASPNEYSSLVQNEKLNEVNELLVAQAVAASQPPAAEAPATQAETSAPQTALESATNTSGDPAEMDAGEPVARSEDASALPDWWLWAAIAGAASILLAGAGFWFMRRRRTANGAGDGDASAAKVAAPAAAKAKSPAEPARTAAAAASTTAIGDDLLDDDLAMDLDLDSEGGGAAGKPAAAAAPDPLDDDLIDDEFNLEDFDIGDTDDLGDGAPKT